MKLEKAYIVYVNSDGDYRTETEGTHVFIGEGAREEFRALVKQALDDLNIYFRKKGWEEVDEDIDVFICQGGNSFGNYDITIDIIGDEW